MAKTPLTKAQILAARASNSASTYGGWGMMFCLTGVGLIIGGLAFDPSIEVQGATQNFGYGLTLPGRMESVVNIGRAVEKMMIFAAGLAALTIGFCLGGVGKVMGFMADIEGVKAMTVITDGTMAEPAETPHVAADTAPTTPMANAVILAGITVAVILAVAGMNAAFGSKSPSTPAATTASQDADAALAAANQAADDADAAAEDAIRAADEVLGRRR